MLQWFIELTMYVQCIHRVRWLHPHPCCSLSLWISIKILMCDTRLKSLHFSLNPPFCIFSIRLVLARNLESIHKRHHKKMVRAYRHFGCIAHIATSINCSFSSYIFVFDHRCYFIQSSSVLKSITENHMGILHAKIVHANIE